MMNRKSKFGLFIILTLVISIILPFVFALIGELISNILLFAINAIYSILNIDMNVTSNFYKFISFFILLFRSFTLPGVIEWGWIYKSWIWVPLRILLTLGFAYSATHLFKKGLFDNVRNQIIAAIIIYLLVLAIGSGLMLGFGYGFSFSEIL